VTDTALVNEVQKDAKLMPVIGYHWLNYLAKFRAEMVDSTLDDLFTDKRNEHERKLALEGYVNAGRLATIYTVLRFTWNTLMESPLGDVFKETEESFLNSLDRAITIQGSIVNNDTELSKFLSGVSELMASQPLLFQASGVSGSFSKVIGKRNKDGSLFLLPNETLAELNKLGVFKQIPTVDSIGKSLDAAGMLVQVADGRRQVKKRLNGSPVWGWLMKGEASVPTEDECSHSDKNAGNGENDGKRPDVPSVPTVPSRKAKKFSQEKIEPEGGKKSFDEIGGNSGYTGNTIKVDAVFDRSHPVPTVPSKASDSGQTPEPAASKPVDSVEADLLAAEERAKSKEDHDKTPEPKMVRWFWVQMLSRYEGHEPYERVKVDEAKAQEWAALKKCAVTGEA
jgi:hypothetical protein